MVEDFTIPVQEDNENSGDSWSANEETTGEATIFNVTLTARADGSEEPVTALCYIDDYFSTHTFHVGVEYKFCGLRSPMYLSYINPASRSVYSLTGFKVMNQSSTYKLIPQNSNFEFLIRADGDGNIGITLTDGPSNELLLNDGNKLTVRRGEETVFEQSDGCFYFIEPANLYRLNLIRHLDRRNDFVLLAIDGTNFGVNKAVFESQTDSFQRLVDEHGGEGQLEFDYSPSAIEGLVAFIYTGMVPDIESRAVELASLASEFDYINLFRAVEYPVTQLINQDNLDQISHIAAKFKSKMIYKALSTFV